MDKNIEILLISTTVYSDFEPKKYMINHLRIWKKRLGENLSEEEIESAFKHFAESFFVESVENDETYKYKFYRYKLKDKYRDFIKNKGENYLKSLN